MANQGLAAHERDRFLCLIERFQSPLQVKYHSEKGQSKRTRGTARVGKQRANGSTFWRSLQ